MDLHCREQSYIARQIASSETEAMRQAAALRYSVFVERMGWMPAEQFPDRLERDPWDADARHFGVFEGGERLCAYARILPPTQPFLLETTFPQLLQGWDFRRHRGCAEVSRMAGLYDEHREKSFVVLLLYKVMHQWSLLHGVCEWLMVIEPKYLRRLNMLAIDAVRIGSGELAFEQHGARHTAIVARVILDQLQCMRTRRRDFHEWLTHLDIMEGSIGPALEYVPERPGRPAQDFCFTTKIHLPREPLPL